MSYRNSYYVGPLQNWKSEVVTLVTMQITVFCDVLLLFVLTFLQNLYLNTRRQ